MGFLQILVVAVFPFGPLAIAIRLFQKKVSVRRLLITSLIALPAFLFLTMGIDIGLLVIPFCKNDPNPQCGGGGFQYLLTIGALFLSLIGIIVLALIRANQDKK